MIDEKPLVSVCVVTYQHAKFIRQALDSILMQKTNFPFEIILGEDESTDGTREICIEYANKYPQKIRLFLRSRKDVIYINGNPTGRYNIINCMQASDAKYIALLEGDDYWTDPLKLQRQFNFLESNKDFILVGHNANINQLNTEQSTLVRNIKSEYKDVNTSDLIIGNPFVTCMTMFRNRGLDKISDILINFSVGDWPLFTMLSFQGKCRFYSESFGFYRVHPNSLTSKNREEYIPFKNELINRMNHALYWNDYSNNKYIDEVNLVLEKRSRVLVNIALKNRDFKTAINYSQYVKIKNLKNYNSKLAAIILKMINQFIK